MNCNDLALNAEQKKVFFPSQHRRPTTFHHRQHQQPEPAPQSRTDRPRQGVKYQTLTPPSKCHSRKWDSPGQPTFSQPSAVQFWGHFVNFRLRLPLTGLVWTSVAISFWHQARNVSFFLMFSKKPGVGSLQRQLGSFSCPAIDPFDIHVDVHLNRCAGDNGECFRESPRHPAEADDGRATAPSGEGGRELFIAAE